MRPAFLCKLQKGTLIDANPGFVDTFNWLVDFVNNLCGDGDLDKSKAVTLDRSKDDHPVIRLDGGAGGKISVTDTDGNTVEGTSLVFASESDSNVKVSAAVDSQGQITLTVGVYYVQSNSSST